MLSSSSSVQTPQVFINFRGKELRNSFVRNLVKALKENSVSVYIDEQERRGEDLSIFFKRIEESKVAVVIITRQYTESRWCLDELVKIKECADLEKIVIIPIFYKVKTEDVKNLDGEFGKNFWELAKACCKDGDLNKWVKALETVPTKLGLTLGENSDEDTFLKKTVKEVLRVVSDLSMNLEQTSDANCTKGVTKGVTETMSGRKRKFALPTDDVGTSGIGKTTMTRQCKFFGGFFSQKFSSMQEIFLNLCNYYVQKGVNSSEVAFLPQTIREFIKTVCNVWLNPKRKIRNESSGDEESIEAILTHGFGIGMSGLGETTVTGRSFEKRQCNFFWGLYTSDSSSMQEFNVGSCDLVPLDDGKKVHSKFIFTNCNNLEQAAKNSITSYAQRKSQLGALRSYEEGNVSKALLITSFPGSEIPSWFNHSSTGSTLELDFPPQSDNRLSTIVLCAVVAFSDTQDEINHFSIECTYEFKNGTDTCRRFSCTLGGDWIEPKKIDSEHVFIGYTSCSHITTHVEGLSQSREHHRCVSTEALIEFKVRDGAGKIVNCGLSLVYEEPKHIVIEENLTRTCSRTRSWS